MLNSFVPSNTSRVSVEEGISDDVIDQLKNKGHVIDGPLRGWDRSLFGRGHVVTRGAWWRRQSSELHDDRATWWAGSDGRTDGVALGY